MNVLNILFLWFCVHPRCRGKGRDASYWAQVPGPLDFLPCHFSALWGKTRSRKMHSQVRHTALQKPALGRRSPWNTTWYHFLFWLLALDFFFFFQCNYSRNSCFLLSPNKHSWRLPQHIHTFLRIPGLIYFHHISLKTLYPRYHSITVHQFFGQHGSHKYLFSA